MRPGFCFMRGSSPTLRFLLPLTLDEAQDTVYASFGQGDRTLLEYCLNGTPTDDPPTGRLYVGTDGRLCVAMTQQDTLRLDNGDVEVQFRVVTDVGADVSLPCVGRVGRTQKEGVL